VPKIADGCTELSEQDSVKTVIGCFGWHLHLKYWNNFTITIIGIPLRMRPHEFFGNPSLAVIAWADDKEVLWPELSGFVRIECFELAKHLVGTGIANPTLHIEVIEPFRTWQQGDSLRFGVQVIHKPTTVLYPQMD